MISRISGAVSDIRASKSILSAVARHPRTGYHFVVLSSSLLKADRALHALHQRRSFSQHLNPLNGPEAARAFRSGAEAPPFRYQPTTWADEELSRLDKLEIPLDHPFGELLQRAVHGTRLFILALRDRTPTAFDALAQNAGWYPDLALLEAARNESHERDSAPFSLDAQAMIDALTDALTARGLCSWRVERDPVMSARVLVDGAKRLLRVSPRARFRQRDIQRLVVHEIEVHAIRATNGEAQALKLFSTGLPGSLETEEGLALYAEECSGSASPGTAWRQGVVVQAADWARRVGFRELYERIAEEAAPGLAWGVSERLKRGLSDPSLPGVYAKDVVYYRGVRRVRAWLDAGNPVGNLYVGKVGVDDPVQQWLDDGLVSLRPVPQLFRDAA